MKWIFTLQPLTIVASYFAGSGLVRHFPKFRGLLFEKVAGGTAEFRKSVYSSVYDGKTITECAD